MRLELALIAVTGFLVYNTYHDGKYTKLFFHYKKYMQMAFFAVVGLSIYLLLKRHPDKGRQMLLHANNMVKYLPIDKSSMHMMAPIIDFTTGSTPHINQNDHQYSNQPQQQQQQQQQQPQQQQETIRQKRSVSETKKKYVAANQNWKCGECNNQLNAWFEIDHQTRLEYGGTNDVSNLVALCRECHGHKTAMENM